ALCLERLSTAFICIGSGGWKSIPLASGKSNINVRHSLLALKSETVIRREHWGVLFLPQSDLGSFLHPLLIFQSKQFHWIANRVHGMQLISRLVEVVLAAKGWYTD